MIIETKFFCRNGYAYAFFGHIVIHPSSPRYLISHEAAHCRRMRSLGYLRWYWRYFTQPEFRFEEEIIAHRAAVIAGQPKWLAAQQLWTNYGLNLNYDTVLKRLGL